MPEATDETPDWVALLESTPHQVKQVGASEAQQRAWLIRMTGDEPGTDRFMQLYTRYGPEWGEHLTDSDTITDSTTDTEGDTSNGDDA